MKLKIVFLLVFLILPLTRKFHAEVDINNAQALFIYNFMSNIKWPEESIGSQYTIGILGMTSTSTYLEKYTTNRVIGTRAIEIKKFSTVTAISNCQILLIARDKSKDISSVNQKFQDKSCLIIGEKEGLSDEGAVIDFAVIDGKLRFKINEQNANNQKLIISSSLLKMSLK